MSNFSSFLSNPAAPLAAFIAVCLILILAVLMLSRRIGKLLKGKDAKTLEDTIVLLQKEISALAEFRQDSEAYFENVEARLRRSIQSVETIRFNPWKGSGEGGNQSFATAILNENGDGVVISSLYSRERTSIFSKPIRKHASEFDLTEEETEALRLSKDSVTAGKSLHI